MSLYSIIHIPVKTAESAGWRIGSLKRSKNRCLKSYIPVFKKKKKKRDDEFSCRMMNSPGQRIYKTVRIMGVWR